MVKPVQLASKKETFVRSSKLSTLLNGFFKIFISIININIVIGILYLINCILTESFGKKIIFAKSIMEIQKPIIDYRGYRGIILENQMKVLLVSDPKTQLAGVSLEVLAGSWYEPNEIPGLAHFLEHMLFMGSKKYPNTSEFTDYLSLNGGTYNAYTSYDRTNFCFELNNGILEQGLDVFSQFFIEPLFDSEAIEKEINAVNSEFEKDYQLDEWRLKSIMQLILNPQNPTSRFYRGNNQTLKVNPLSEGINVRDELIKFFKTYYSSNLMALTIIGNYSLDKLENIASQKFGQVKNLNTILPDLSKIPLITSKEAPTITQYFPISPNTTLYFAFNFPSIQKYYLQKPLRYLFNLIVDADNGTLPSLLKQKGYISYFDSNENYFDLNSETLSIIYMTLTESGIDHLFDIIELIFQQVNLIKINGISYERFQEYQQISQIYFDYGQWDTDIMSIASDFSTYLNRYSIEDVLTGHLIFYVYDAEVINLFLKNLIFNQALIIIASPEFNFSENSTETSMFDVPNHKIHFGKLNMYNRLYNVNYSHYPVPQQFRDYINQINYSTSSGFGLPPFNNFIPKNLSLIQNCSTLKCNQDFEDDKNFLPYLIESNDSRKIFYQLDRSYLTPTIAMNLRMYSPIIYKNFQAYINSLIFCTAKSIALESKFYEFAFIGYFFGYQCQIYGMDLTLEGYSDNFLEANFIIANGIKNINITKEFFEMSRQKVINDNISRKTIILADYAITLVNITILKGNYLIDEISQGLNNINYTTYLQNTNDLLDNLFMDGIIIGNLDQSTALNIQNNITRSIGYHPVNNSGLFDDEYLDLTNLSLVYREFSDHEGSTENCLVNYYQDTFYTIKNLTLLYLLNAYMNPQIYTILRTKKQLGYTVGSKPLVINRMNGILLFIQGPVMDPNSLDLEVEIFLKDFENDLRSMNDSYFKQLKDGIRSQLIQEPNDLDKKLMRYALRLADKTYNFDIYNQMISNLKAISIEDLLQFHLNLFRFNQKKLSIQLYAQGKNKTQILPNEILSKSQVYSGIQPILIKDLKELRSFRFIKLEDNSRV